MGNKPGGLIGATLARHQKQAKVWANLRQDTELDELVALGATLAKHQKKQAKVWEDFDMFFAPHNTDDTNLREKIHELETLVETMERQHQGSPENRQREIFNRAAGA